MYLFLTILFMGVGASYGNNGEFITAHHEWGQSSSAVVPIYLGIKNYEKELGETFPEKPQAICTGTLINEGKQLLSAAHCFQRLCPSKKMQNILEYFFLLGDEKIILSNIKQHPKFCYFTYEIEHEKKLAPNPFMPELSRDVALARVPLDKRSYVREEVKDFPVLDLSSFNIEKHTYHTVGFGVSDRFIFRNTLWLDEDKDNVHDSWDLCKNTQTVLIPGEKNTNPSDLMKTNGCDESQTPPRIPIALDYYTSTMLSQKRGYSFEHSLNKEFIFEQYRISSEPFIVNHGYRGSFPYEGLQALSFGGDSGAPVFVDGSLKKIVAITNLYSGVRGYALENIINRKTKGPMPKEERRRLLSGGFNVFLLLSHQKDFLEEAMIELN